jgi:hypothetical protein
MSLILAEMSKIMSEMYALIRTLKIRIKAYISDIICSFQLMSSDPEVGRDVDLSCELSAS